MTGDNNGNGVFKGAITTKVETLEREMSQIKPQINKIDKNFSAFAETTRVHRFYLRISIFGIYALIGAIAQHIFFGWF